MREIKTPEALDAARLIDRQPEHTRAYLRDMLYRVLGLDGVIPQLAREHAHLSVVPMVAPTQSGPSE